MSDRLRSEWEAAFERYASSGLCECGCGQQTRISPKTIRAKGWVKGEPRRFLSGHNKSRLGAGVPLEERYTEEDRGYETPCWVWHGPLSYDGYGITPNRKGSRLAHRALYVQRVGPVPEGLELDHLCRVRCCVNPAHLEPVTHAENQRRGIRAKLTAEQVREIRSSGLTQMALAARYGVTQPHISAVKRGKVWSDLAA